MHCRLSSKCKSFKFVFYSAKYDNRASDYWIKFQIATNCCHFYSIHTNHSSRKTTNLQSLESHECTCILQLHPHKHSCEIFKIRWTCTCMQLRSSQELFLFSSQDSTKICVGEPWGQVRDGAGFNPSVIVSAADTRLRLCIELLCGEPSINLLANLPYFFCSNFFLIPLQNQSDRCLKRVLKVR